MPLAQLTAGFALCLRVFDIGSVLEFETTSGERWDYSAPVRDVVSLEIGGYHVAAKREEASWDAIAAVLVALEANHADRFHELMRAVRSVSNSRREADGFHSLLDDREQMMFDITSEREQRRQRRGFLSPADARAFLENARSATTESISPDPIAREYARSIEVAEPRQDDEPIVSVEEEAAVAELLADAGVAPLQAPRALLESGNVEGQTKIQRLLQVVVDRDPVAYGERNFELAYLANVLISGCSIQARPFTPKEAADGAVAICNLGLEHLGDLPHDYLVKRDLIGAFQIGWSVLHREAVMYSAAALADVLSKRCVADDHVQSELSMLRMRLLRELEKGTPWRVGDALDILSNVDLPAWAAILALIAECPVIHAGLKASLDSRVRSVDPNAFDFISTPDQLVVVRKFMAVLPGILSA